MDTKAPASRELDDLAWVLAQTEQLASLRPFYRGEPAVTLPEWLQRPQKPLLILELEQAESRTPLTLTLVLPQRHAHRLDQMNGLEYTDRFERFQSTIDGLLVAGFKPNDPMDRGATDQLVSALLGRFLLTGRPLRHYGCTFLLPLDLALDSELELAENAACLCPSESDEVERHRVSVPESMLKIPREQRDEYSESAAHAQAYEFFYTHLRDQLFETDRTEPESEDQAVIHPIKHWKLRPAVVRRMELEMEELTGALEGQKTVAKVEDVSLYEYYNGIFVLGLRVGMPPNPEFGALTRGRWKDSPDALSGLCSDGPDWWRALIFCPDTDLHRLQALQCEKWLRYTKITRLLFAAFLEQYTENKIARVILHGGGQAPSALEPTSHFSPVVCCLIQKFLPALKPEELRRPQRLGEVSDQRMFCHVAYGLSGHAPGNDPVQLDQLKRLFSYALYVDHADDSWDAMDQWAYDPEFVREELARQTLQRWQRLGNLAGFTNYSSAFMGVGSFFQDSIARVHIPYLYLKMQVLALLFRATLNRFDRRISFATQALINTKGDTGRFRDLRHDFIEFTNKYWFRKLSPQIQGQEICAHMMKQQALDEKYELVKDEMERADEYTNTLREQRFQDIAHRLTVFGAMLAVAGLVLGLLTLESRSNQFIVIFSAFFVWAIAAVIEHFQGFCDLFIQRDPKKPQQKPKR